LEKEKNLSEPANMGKKPRELSDESINALLSLAAQKDEKKRFRKAGSLSRTAKWIPAKPVKQVCGKSKPRLLDRVRQEIKTRHYSRSTEKTYVYWIKQFVFLTT
jgi:Phage integrase, N-terminal SAM-like domain